MLDQAGIQMAQGAALACERIAGVNDNMHQPHYHNYYELYYLEDGGRYHRIENELYLLNPGELILFSPYSMHYSYGDLDMPFKRIVLYFRPDQVDSPELLRLLDQENGIYRPGSRETLKIRRILTDLLQEQGEGGQFSHECCHCLLNLLLCRLARQKRADDSVKAEQKRRVVQVMRYIHQHYDENITLENLAERFFVSPFYLCREF